MAHNKLRRDIDTYLNTGTLPDAGPMDLLKRALVALGGPVEDSRTLEQELIADGRKPLPELEPIPDGPRPETFIDYHGLPIQLQAVVRGGVWVAEPYNSGKLCDGRACLRDHHDGLTPHGPYHFCNEHFGQLMDNIAKEQAPLDAQMLAAAAGELDAYVPSPADIVKEDNQ